MTDKSEETFDYITPIKPLLEQWMHKSCLTFMVIGTPRETPRYFNFKDFNRESKTLTISSTQKELGFRIPVPFNHIDSTEFWKQFKAFRTEFLITNYKTINPY